MSTAPKTKIAHRRFFRWDYAQEQRLLDEDSAQGWQLSGRTPWRVTYEYDPTVRYRYAIDFRRDHDEARYLDTCREMGWELVTGLGDATPLDWSMHGFPWNDYFTPKAHPADGKWYIFRKPYDPEAPEEEYALETDPESRRDMHQQIVRKYNWLCLRSYSLWVILFIVLGNRVWEPSTLRTAVYALAIVLWAVGNGIYYLWNKFSLSLPKGWLTRRVKNALRTASTLFWALVTLAVLALLAANLVQLASSLSHLPGMIYDPVSYLEYTSYIPVTQDTQIDVYTTGTLTVVLTEDGESYLFTRPKETSKTWSYRYFGSTEWEGMYYIPAGGLYPYHVVMVADDGTVYEPVYEAHFENGYAPVFAFDVSQEQEYHGLVVCRDESGVYHYDCTAVTYAGLSDWENVPESDYRRDICTSFTTPSDTSTVSQSAFITAYNAWKATVYNTDPADLIVAEDNFFLNVTYTYPPTLSVTRHYSVKGVFTGYEGGTGGNALVQRVYDYQNGQAVFYWNQRFSSGLWSLIQADDLTLEQVQAATRSSGAGRTPQNVVTYAVTVPDSLISLWQEAIS
jgi:hypothetical protein